MNANDSELYYFILLSTGAIAAIVNIIKAINRSGKDLEIKQLNKIIGDQNEIITGLEKSILKYQEFIKDGTGRIY